MTCIEFSEKYLFGKFHRRNPTDLPIKSNDQTEFRMVSVDKVPLGFSGTIIPHSPCLTVSDRISVSGGGSEPYVKPGLDLRGKGKAGRLQLIF